MIVHRPFHNVPRDYYKCGVKYGKWEGRLQFIREFTPPPRIYPFFVLMQVSWPPTIYPSLQEYRLTHFSRTICDTPRIYPPARIYLFPTSINTGSIPPPPSQLYATLPEFSTPPSQNIPLPFLQLYVTLPKTVPPS